MSPISLFENITVDTKYCLVVLLDIIVALHIMFETTHWLFKGQGSLRQLQSLSFVLLTTKQYLGSTGNTIKQRYRNHKSSFNKINKRHATELANYIWNLKDNNNTDYKIKWEVLNRTKSKFNTKFGCKLNNLKKNKINQTRR